MIVKTGWYRLHQPMNILPFLQTTECAYFLIRMNRIGSIYPFAPHKPFVSGVSN